MEFKELVDISGYTTFRMGPPTRYFGVVKDLNELAEGFAFARDKNLPVFILGSGSNIIMAAADIYEAVVLKIEILGFEVLPDESGSAGDTVLLKIGAGENWDSVVERAVEQNWCGIEALSWIPGTAGATPIQNVGAYGTEIADVLVSLEAYEISTGKQRTFTKEECQFSYRDSFFKHDAKNKYVITSITIQLSKNPGTVPDYPGVKKYFDNHNIVEPTLTQIRQAIIDIRNIKLPDPKVIASVGSFFKNPIVTGEQHEQIKEKYPNIIAFPLEDGNFKIGAGWLLETLGYKGKEIGNLQFYSNNALVLVNKGGATFSELDKLVVEVQAKVQEKFGIKLEMEPIITQNF